MNIPFKPDDILELYPSYNVQFIENEKILIIDNWYKNFIFFQKILSQLPLPRWKWNLESRNFLDYYDCRPTINSSTISDEVSSHYLNALKTLIKIYFKDHGDLELKNNLLEFNFFKHLKKNVNVNLQHYPHLDFKYNCIVYFDNICSGGTAIYPEIKLLENKETNNLLYDVENFQIQLIKSKPNRLIIFEGKKYHGGYIENHNDYVDNWRINQILFFGE